MPADYRIRQLSAEDEPMLWEALYQGLHTAAGDVPPPRDIVQRPELARYVKGWGRKGDRGFAAFDAETSELLGAVWFREPTAAAPKPELVVVVAPGQRKRGIGAALLTQWVRANPDQSEVALRMNASNPAVRLYERFGFRVVNEADGLVTLRRELGGG